MAHPAGIGNLDRRRITEILRNTKSTVSVKEAAAILAMSKESAAKLLARWTIKGWFARIKRGIYIPVPLESITADISLEDPWIIAERIYHPCYIGGWSAAEYWGYTDQIFRTIVVFTMQKPRDRHPNIKGTDFLLRTISKKAMFGLKSVWRGQVKVSVSDPSRTILDLLIDPALGGGIRSVIDMFGNYLKSENKDLERLIGCAKQINNGAVFKRLGYLLEEYASTESKAIEECNKQLTTGNIKIDPQLDAEKLITRWRLWIPKDWNKK